MKRVHPEQENHRYIPAGETFIPSHNRLKKAGIITAVAIGTVGIGVAVERTVRNIRRKKQPKIESL